VFVSPAECPVVVPRRRWLWRRAVRVPARRRRAAGHGAAAGQARRRATPASTWPHWRSVEGRVDSVISGADAKVS
jgi:hypothetical protein